MNIKVAAFTVSQKSINIKMLTILWFDCYVQMNPSFWLDIINLEWSIVQV